MAITTRKNQSVKALQSIMASKKKQYPDVMLEWELACNTNVNRGRVYKQEEILQLYARDSYSCEAGASKTCHLFNHNGNAFNYIVIKRHQTDGYIDEHAYNPDTKQTGNQLIDEINCWNEFAETEYADLLCPILKYFTSKSDKVTAISKKMQRNVVIIAQRAIKVGSARRCCQYAEDLNNANGLAGMDAESRYSEMQKFSDKQGWRDAMHNPGNCGVIFDYNQNCYKAVFIDYAL